MLKEKVIINNLTGLCLNPAGLFCRTAMQFKCQIMFRHKDTSANAKSILSVLGACIKQGDEIELICDGEDEEEALRTMIQIIEGGLGE